MKRKPKPEKPVPVDPKATVFSAGDKVEVIRPASLWTGYKGEVISVNGGMCHVALSRSPLSSRFPADIPASELRKI